MSIRFEDTGPPADEEDLALLEERTGHALPVAYRDFLEAHDGAQPEGNSLPDAVGGHDIVVHAFFSAEEVLRQLDALGPDRVPNELLPVADDDLGGPGVWVNVEDGSVWSYDHDAEDPEEVDLWAAFTKEAEDLEEFLDRLEPDSSDLDDDPEPLEEGFIDTESFQQRAGGVEDDD